MSRIILFVLLVCLAGCVQNPNGIPDDNRLPDDTSVFDPKSEAISRDILRFARASDRETLRKYAAMYRATADALDQSPQNANKIIQSCEKAHTEFVGVKIPGMTDVAVSWLPPTSNAENNRAEISKIFRALSQGCLKASSQAR